MWYRSALMKRSLPRPVTCPVPPCCLAFYRSVSVGFYLESIILGTISLCTTCVWCYICTSLSCVLTIESGIIYIFLVRRSFISSLPHFPILLSLPPLPPFPSRSSLHLDDGSDNPTLTKYERLIWYREHLFIGGRDVLQDACYGGCSEEPQGWEKKKTWRS